MTRSNLGAVVRAGLLISLASFAVACASGGGGGGGGGSSSSAPILPPLSPPVAPPPPPPPPPATFYETPEYFGSNFVGETRSGLGPIGASSAYAVGGTGEGVVVAVIDTNIDTSISKLSGQMAAGGIDIRASDRSATDIDRAGHATMVATTIVGKKTGSGVHGVAFDAKVLAIRADRPGSCQETGEDKGCRFRDTDVAAAIDYAIAHGARVINLSLGGDINTDQTMENAVRRAVQAGILVVVSAGNEGKAATSTAAAEGQTPTEPAYMAGQASSKNMVVAVGAWNQYTRKIADFSNRAGATQNYYLLAPGVRMVTAGIDDDVRMPDAPSCSATVTANCNDTNADGNYWAATGTSFSSPIVAGALALMLDAFPNITPENALKALLMTADDYTDTTLDPIRGEAAGAGADAVSGVGVLNLTRAFQPIGASSFSFGDRDVPVAALLAPASGAMGDWMTASGAFKGMVFQDVLQRGFRMDDAPLLTSRSTFSDMSVRADYARAQARAVDYGRLSFSWFSPPARSYDPRTPWAEAPDANFTATMRLNGVTVSTGRGGGPERLTPAMMLTDDPSGPASLQTGGMWTSVEQTFGPMTLDLRVSNATGRSASGAGVGFTSLLGKSRIGYGAYEDRLTAAGGAFQSRFGETDQGRMSAMSFENVSELNGWRLSASAEAASVRLDGVDVDGVWTSAWALSAARPLAGGSIRFTTAQPRRAEGGRFTFEAPIEVTKSGALLYELRTAGLTPSGRQLNFETSWSRTIGPQTTVETALALSTSPNHVAEG